MKKIINTVIITGFFLAMPLTMLAQTPPHPNGGNAPGSTNTPVGGGAPIDGGISIMLVLGAAYGIKKIYKMK